MTFDEDFDVYVAHLDLVVALVQRLVKLYRRRILP